MVVMTKESENNDDDNVVTTSVYLSLSSLYSRSILGKITIDNSQITSIWVLSSGSDEQPKNASW
jgi:hypothetical protein